MRAGLERETIRGRPQAELRQHLARPGPISGISRPTLYGLLTKFNIDRP